MYSVTSSLHRRLKSPKPLGVRAGEDANDHSWLVPPPPGLTAERHPVFFFRGFHLKTSNYTFQTSHKSEALG